MNIRERGEGWRRVSGVYEMLTQFAGLEVNVCTSMIHTSVCVECACVRVGTHELCAPNVTHAKTRNDHTHTREGIYECTPQPSRYTSSEGAWGVNIRERGEGWREVSGVHSMLTQLTLLEVNIRTSINHT